MQKNQIIHSIRRVQRQKEQKDFSLERYIARLGWERTSHTPTCCWIWRKEFEDYGVVAGNLLQAIEYELAYYDLHMEEYRKEL